MTPTWPIVRASGPPGERGRSYGEQAADRIARSVEIYTQVFGHYAGLSWAEVRERAAAFAEPVDAFDPELLPEMRGIADGAGLELEDVLALNVRTEVMFGLRLPVRECTALVALPEATRDGHTLLAQNWDWKPDTRDTLILLAMAPEGRPAFVSLVEAGLLAKTGMNEAGIGLATNALVSDRDEGRPGVPYHAILRRILTSSQMAEALNAIFARERASSANYLIAHRDGEAIDVETAPGDVDATFRLYPEDGVLVHANHFEGERFPFRDTGLIDGADSLVRHRRAASALARERGTIRAASLERALQDHFDLPSSVCSHASQGVEPVADYATVSSIVMDLTEPTLWVSAGLPCETPFVRYGAEELLSPSRAVVPTT